MPFDAPSMPRFALQHTVQKAVQLVGIGLHSGADVTLALAPAPADSGITFIRSDVEPDAARVPARWDLISDTKLCTTLRNSAGTVVMTTEHVMAALRGCGVDNATINLNNAEVPIMDGSAQPFVDLIHQAGLQPQMAPRQAIHILQPIKAQIGDSWAILNPSTTARYEVLVDYTAGAIGQQQFVLEGETLTPVAAARTFGFKKDIDALRAIGLAQGGSLDNAIVVDGDHVLNPEGLRYADEFARHKALDAVGDLALAGAPLMAAYQGYKPGHGVHAALLQALFANPRAWCLKPMRPQTVREPSMTELLEAAVLN